MNDHGLPPLRAPEPGRDERGRTPRPPFDPSSAVVFDALPLEPFRLDQLGERRALEQPVEEILAPYPDIERREITCPGHGGDPIELAVFRRRGDADIGPGFFNVHGGGMVMGTRYHGLPRRLDAVRRHGGTVVSVEYRLAPEFPAPTPVEDCYAALTYVAQHAGDLGIDATQLILNGGSAGGGLATGVMLLARDRGGPALLGVQLDCPMLDDRNDSLSVRQFDLGGGFWDGQSNAVGWGALLGAARGTDAVSPYDAPARAVWLGGLPPVQIVVGSADAFRDENVAFAHGLWRDGGDCELFVVPGGPHGFDVVTPEASISRIAREVRAAWIARLLSPDDLAPAHAVAETLR